MAVEVESKSQVQEFLEVLLRRRWLVLLPAATVLTLGIFVAVIVPKKFVARTEVELRPVGVSISNKTAQDAPFQIKALSRLVKIVEELQNSEYLALPPEDRQDWLFDLQRSVAVRPTLTTTTGTSFVVIEYSDVQKEWARDFLKALRDDWIDDVVERDRRTAQTQKATLLEQRNGLDRELKRADEAWTELVRREGLSTTTDDRVEEPAFTKVRENEERLAQKESEAASLVVEIAALERRLAELPPRIERVVVAKDAVSNQAEIDKLDKEILKLQKQLKGIRPSNSKYGDLQREIRDLESERERLERYTAREEENRSSQPNPEIDKVATQLDTAKDKLTIAHATIKRIVGELEVDRARADELHYVKREARELHLRIQRLSEQLATADQVLQAKTREVEQLLSPVANPFEIIQEVSTPNKPTEPNPMLIVVFSLLLGLGLGLGCALLLEFSRSCFRTASDVTRVMAVPVLGSVAKIVTRREARVSRARAAAVAACSLAFVAAILFVTWAWANDAKYLSPDLRDTIEGLRSRLR